MFSRIPLLPWLSLLLHAYVALRLAPELFSWPPLAVMLLLSLAVSAWLMPLGIGFGARLAGASRGASGIAIWLGWAGLGMFSTLLVLTFGRDVLLALAYALRLALPGRIDMPALAHWSALVVFALGYLITLIGYGNARRTAAIVRVDVPIAGLPPELAGFSIAQISDIHVGPTIREGYLRRIVDAVNRLEADMVAITGDLVDGSVQELAAHVAPLALLQSRHGSFFVTGNHEYYSGAHAWIAELNKLDIRVLMNEHVTLHHDNALAVVAGVADYSAGHFDPAHTSDPQRAIAGAPPAGVRLLLAHQPRSVFAALDAGFDLQLSGHTHGGQFLPWTYFVRLQQPFVAGLHRLRDTWIYISRGTGYWGPPKRFGAPSEITLIRLVAA
ncbi:metallophosphoesterase [Noviherbaspirillum pedocola]|uniref:Metallophosphoesterase n=1 Tax=Noviherbaspirillum pedocola TaxID=2801341 RepID=A0A934SWV7_9BURK|nr:metallophosphoesterase [Noviherbaspirillum pedocola]MBK4737242.1 metallophosphoesterase [Noviherbaspirillum pedocola]